MTIITLKDIEKQIQSKTDGICYCPKSEIEYLVGLYEDKDEFCNIKTGKCKRCSGIRLNKFGFVLKGKRRLK